MSRCFRSAFIIALCSFLLHEAYFKAMVALLLLAAPELDVCTDVHAAAGLVLLS